MTTQMPFCFPSALFQSCLLFPWLQGASSGHVPLSVPHCIYNFLSPLPVSRISFALLALLLESRAFISGVGGMVSIRKLCIPPIFIRTGSQCPRALLIAVFHRPQFALLKHNDLIFFSLMTWPYFFPWIIHYGWHYLCFPFCPGDKLQAVHFPYVGQESTDHVLSTS